MSQLPPGFVLDNAPHPAGGHVFTLPPDPSKVASEQRAAQSSAREQADFERRQREWNATHNADGSPKSADGALTPEAVVFAAQKFLTDGQLPSLGMGKQAAADREAILNEAARQQGAAGLRGADLSRQIAHYKAGSRQLSNLETQLGTITASEETALLNGQQFIDRSAELPAQTRFSPINSITQGLERIGGGKTIAAADAAFNTFASEYAKVVSGSPSGAGTLSDSARHEAQETMRSNASIEQKRAAFEQMKRDMENRIASIHGSINDGYQHLTETPGYRVPETTTGLPLPSAKKQDNRGLPGVVPGVSGGGSPPNGGGPSVWQTPHIVGGGGPGAAGFGATTGSDPTPPGYQQAYQAFVKSGQWTPNQYASFRTQLDKQYFPDAADQTDTYKAEGQRILGQLQKGGDINLTVPPVNKRLSGFDRFRNDLVDNPLGAAAVGAADAGGFGLVSRLAPGQMGTLANSSPLNAGGMALGQIGGAITGANMLGKGAGMLTDLSPTNLDGLLRLKLGKSGAALTTDTLKDAAYGGAYGAGSGQGAAGDAAIGGASSLGGRFVGSALGKAVGGIPLAQAVQTLQARGIPMTIGQKLGGVVKGAEDAATSLPLIGDIVNARRLEGLRAFNKAAFNDAGAPINAAVSTTGEQGVQSLLGPNASGGGAIGNAYDAATAGVHVPLDPQFGQDIAAARQAGQALPDDLASRFNLALNNRVDPILGTDAMTGDQYQQAFRGLKGYRAETTKPGFEQDYRNSLTQAMDALTGQMNRGGGADVVNNLANADQAYRSAKTLQDAVKRARNGSRSGEVQTFTPSQLVDAGTANASKYPGPRPFADLADAGQSVLPSKLPDSGTGRRLLQASMGLGALGAGQASDSYLGTDLVNPDTVGALSILALGGTKGGQQMLDKLLFSRPDLLQRAGRSVNKYRGLFGSAAVPLAIESSN